LKSSECGYVVTVVVRVSVHPHLGAATAIRGRETMIVTRWTALIGLVGLLIAGCGFQPAHTSDLAEVASRVEQQLGGLQPDPAAPDGKQDAPGEVEEAPNVLPVVSDEGPAPDAVPGAQQVSPSPMPVTSDQTLPVVYPWRPSEPQPTGTWLLEQGNMLPTFVAGLATFGTTTDVTALILNEDGTGRVFLRDRLTGANDCVRVFAIYNGETLALDFAAETTTDVQFNVAIEDYTYFFPVVVPTHDSLGLADENGLIALFSRQTELPAEVTCGELVVDERFDGLPAPQFFSDLVLFNGDLVYNSGSAGQIEAFDLDTDTLGTPLGPTSSRLIQTVQDGFFWTHCGCGGSRDAFKRTLSTVVDTVSSENEMGGAITFRAMAYDQLNDRLWLHGRPFDNQFGQFFIVNTNGEPDIVEDTISFNRDLRALSYDFGGPDLWGIVTVASQVVVQIDPTTGKVLESYEVPDEDVSWSGLTFDEEFMYLLGTDLAGDGVLLRVLRPQ